MYAPPSVGSAGLTVNTFADILEDLITNFQAIYGPNIYLGTDSEDYQELSILAERIRDQEQALVYNYHSISPATAIGAALDSVVKINGIIRKASSYSTCVVTLTGVSGTTIEDGIVQDVNGVNWDLDPFVTIPVAGTVDVTVTCEQLGAVAAAAHTLTNIYTPTAGWLSVDNAAAAVVGQPVETDSQLRARQTISVALPSFTTLVGTIAAIAAVSGVTRYNWDENATNVTNANGNPAHSVTFVVEGGSDADVALAIYMNRGLGCLTNGTTNVPVTDPVTGFTTTINFDRPVYKNINAILRIKQLAGYTTATEAAILAAVTSYLNSLQIGELITDSGLYGAALSVMSDLTKPLFSIGAIWIAVDPTTPTVGNDITVAFNEVSKAHTISFTYL